MLARQRRSTVSAVATELLDKALPRWTITRDVWGARGVAREVLDRGPPRHDVDRAGTAPPRAPRPRVDVAGHGLVRPLSGAAAHPRVGRGVSSRPRGVARPRGEPPAGPGEPGRLEVGHGDAEVPPGQRAEVGGAAPAHRPQGREEPLPSGRVREHPVDHQGRLPVARLRDRVAVEQVLERRPAPGVGEARGRSGRCPGRRRRADTASRALRGATRPGCPGPASGPSGRATPRGRRRGGPRPGPPRPRRRRPPGR